MAATLIALRWRLTLGALRKNPWAVVGTIIGLLHGAGLLLGAGIGAVALGGLAAPADTAAVLGGLGALIVAGWAVVPLFLTGVDSTLDPRAIAAWTAPSPALARGLLAAAACGIPGVLTAVALLLPAVVWLAAGEPAAAGLALLCAPAGLATCVLLSRLVVIRAGVWASRRGRETTAVIASILIMVAALIPSLVPRILEAQGAQALAGLRTAATALGLSPLGWSFSAPGLLVTGPAWAGPAAALGAWILPLALLRPWRLLVTRVMTSAGPSAGASQSYASGHRWRSRSHGSQAPAAGRAAAGAGGGAPTAPTAPTDAIPEVLPWAAGLTRLLPALPAACAATAARCLRYWRSDPRYLVQAIPVLMLPVLLVAMPVLGAARVSVNGQEVRTSMALGQAPTAMLLIVPVLVLMMGWSIHNDIGYDSTAVWSHMSAGVPGRQDLAGRALAALVWQAPVAAIGVAGISLWTGRWDAAPALIGGSLALHGCALAWSLLTSVLLPYEVVPPGASPLSSRTSGTALVAALLQALGILVILLAAAPVGAPAVAAVVTGRTSWGWLLIPVGAAWGAGALALSISRAGRLLDRRGPELLATIQSWPGHSQTA
ncbi:transporter [Actinomyces bowdenii]|uniref:transporter n=1 Tax=Actinomyces bowdenii TaxID=131109 RepID=UPI001ABCA5B4|nr:transporter [Actinomyces bowdenii]MBO3724753.1 transporter [Actinomyces bowdenii]